MALRFEEIDWQQTDQGEISLRRRHDLVTDSDVSEVKLGEEFLMSSLFTAAEIELSHLALAEIDRPRLRVMVGGLGLGYTAQAALADPRVAEVTVVELNEPVLEWHRRGLLPDVVELGSDPRCQLVQDDFFRLAAAEPERTYDAILLDIDHSPHHALSPTHQAFYTAPSLAALSRHLTDDGVFALWSDDRPDQVFEAVLSEVFSTVAAHVVEFANPLTGGVSSNTVYVARQ